MTSVLSVDIGSTGISVCYKKEGSNDVNILPFNGMSKVPSSFVLKKNVDKDQFEVLYIGQDVEKKAKELAESIKKNEDLFECRGVKKAFTERSKFNVKQVSTGNLIDFTKHINAIFRAYIIYIIRYVVNSKDGDGSKMFESDDLRNAVWIFPVATVWKNEQWKEHRENCSFALKKALALGSKDADFCINTEPTAAVAELIKGKDIKIGSYIICIDLGGLTSDVSVFKRTENGLTSVDIDFGDYEAIGSHMFNEGGMELFKKILGEDCFRFFENDLAARFEDLKKGESDIIPLNLGDYALKSGKNLEQLKSGILKSAGFGKIEKDCFIIAREDISEGVFGPVYDELCKLCGTFAEKICEKVPNVADAHIMICGGWSRDKKAREIVMRAFGQEPGECVKDPELAVAKGSVMLGSFTDGPRFSNVSIGMDMRMSNPDGGYMTHPMPIVKLGDPVAQFEKKMFTLYQVDDEPLKFTLHKLDQDTKETSVLYEISPFVLKNKLQCIKFQMMPNDLIIQCADSIEELKENPQILANIVHPMISTTHIDFNSP